MTVLVFGSLHWDAIVAAPRLPAPDETLMGTDATYRFGGKGGNQALAAAAAGARVAFAGAVGTDEAAPRLLARLDGAGIDRSRVATVNGPSGMSVAIDTGADYGAVVVSGANLHATPGDQPTDLRVALIQNEVPAAANLALARALPAHATLILNAAPFRPLDPALLARVDILVVNRVEAAQMGADAFGDHVTVVTRGGDGADLHRDGTTTYHPAEKVEVFSTHGAGDVFCGVLAAGLAIEQSLPDAIARAQTAAAVHVSNRRR
ncbi:PfkB family carbohydrate kinase [Jannaschia sp. S6380]|uniref:PfkB family carbohydrate kinase n=1 Tax=Jannaschia sp. S6380 TaxID=2926408 RepID=UPI001FF475D2|nr:PfkB family carbohydrate kinase [Jannaschia sp. S6380]